MKPLRELWGVAPVDVPVDFRQEEFQELRQERELK